ncbi:hypothetical protein SDC9_105019 [bioreactor metagenome]|uniref:Uncharacterized protein n=1 Tax=bioreactor metagenome TaxID=1076179 RepID=A0A645AYI7_9ZZZZ
MFFSTQGDIVDSVSGCLKPLILCITPDGFNQVITELDIFLFKFGYNFGYIKHGHPIPAMGKKLLHSHLILAVDVHADSLFPGKCYIGGSTGFISDQLLG